MLDSTRVHWSHDHPPPRSAHNKPQDSGFRESFAVSESMKAECSGNVPFGTRRQQLCVFDYWKCVRDVEETEWLTLCFHPPAKTDALLDLPHAWKRTETMLNWSEELALTWEKHQWRINTLCDVTNGQFPEENVQRSRQKSEGWMDFSHFWGLIDRLETKMTKQQEGFAVLSFWQVINDFLPITVSLCLSALKITIKKAIPYFS